MDITITDYLGRQINSQQLSPGTHTINLGTVKNGAYSINYKNTSEKFIYLNQ